MKKIIFAAGLLASAQLVAAAPFSPAETHYVKLDFRGSSGGNICGGSLVGSDLVLTDRLALHPGQLEWCDRLLRPPLRPARGNHAQQCQAQLDQVRP
ncbi:hypothetical protein JOS77_12340 [Chromobacterium haemolyticum]|nr:hypothetical protein JOS77_12340 [Chromobacterium haemolyticum]